MFQSILLTMTCLSYTRGEGPPKLPPIPVDEHITAAEDPSRNDYCSMYCFNVQHTGCDCKLGPGRKDILAGKTAPGLRAGIVHHHNFLRNLIAMGNDTRGKALNAANMMAISYNIELEYLARCFLRSRFIGYEDECRTMANGRKLGQNAGGTDMVDTSDTFIYKFIDRWYDEIMEMTASIFRNFKIERNVGHFTTMAWGEVNAVGCGRVIVNNPKTIQFLYPSFRTILLCNYGSTLPGDHKKFGVNVLGRPVYTPGEACSKCPNKLKCNDVYKGLCGEVVNPPDVPEYDFTLVDYNPKSPKVKPFKKAPNKPQSKTKPKSKFKTKPKIKPKAKAKAKAKPKPNPKKGKSKPVKIPLKKPKTENDDNKKTSPKKTSKKQEKKPDLEDPENRSIKEGTSIVMICSMSLLIVYFVY